MTERHAIKSMWDVRAVLLTSMLQWCCSMTHTHITLIVYWPRVTVYVVKLVR